MPRYVAFLRGVMPTNATMPELERCFERAGFTGVKAVLGSGNVAFDARTAPDPSLEKKAEASMAKRLGRSFSTIVRPSQTLRDLVAADPFTAFTLPANAKRVVTFLRTPPDGRLVLPPEIDGARILVVKGREVFTVYVPNAKGPVFMTLIEKICGKDVTTRTWDTVKKCAVA